MCQNEAMIWPHGFSIGPTMVHSGPFSYMSRQLPANTKRNKHVIITSKRSFDVIITCLSCCVFAGVLFWNEQKSVAIRYGKTEMEIRQNEYS